VRRFRPSLTYANVISTICLFLVLGGGAAFAAAHLGKNSVGSEQLKPNAVTSVKVKNGSLKAIDFARDQLPAGAKGDRGPIGPQGATGIVNLLLVEAVGGGNGGVAPLLVSCPGGQHVVSGGVNSQDPKFHVVTNMPAPDGTGWLGKAADKDGTDGKVTVFVLCSAEVKSVTKP